MLFIPQNVWSPTIGALQILILPKIINPHKILTPKNLPPKTVDSPKMWRPKMLNPPKIKIFSNIILQHYSSTLFSNIILQHFCMFENFDLPIFLNPKQLLPSKNVDCTKILIQYKYLFPKKLNPNNFDPSKIMTFQKSWTTIFLTPWKF